MDPFVDDRELSLLLFLAGPPFLKDDANQTNLDINVKNIDWKRFLNQAISHGVAPSIYLKLKGGQYAPEEIEIKLEMAYLQAFRKNCRQLDEVERLVELLKNQAIRCMPLKGATASFRMFGDLGAYPSGDIDLLVHLGQLNLAKACLEADGYELLDPLFNDYKEYYLKERYHIAFKKGEYEIELHWKLFFRYVDAPPDFWWERTKVVQLDGKKFETLSNEGEILYLAFRLFSKGFYHLKFLQLLSAAISHHQKSLDWDLLLNYARKYKFLNGLSATLLFANKTLNAPIPGCFLKDVDVRSTFLLQYAKRRLEQGSDPGSLIKLPLVLGRDDFIGGGLVLMKRLLPHIVEVADRYNLRPRSLKLWFFYMANPFFLLLNFTKRKNRS